MLFEAIYSQRTQWLLDHVSEADYATLRRCIVALEQNPYPGPGERVPLVIPHQRGYPDAYRCDGWAIAFRVVDDAFVFIEEIGRQWPPSRRT